jgi:hypothetical protein
MAVRLKNSCFIHIPRTGGLWFEKVLHEIGIKHQILRGDIDSHFSYNELPYNWKVLHSFSFVRHPLNWIKSRWSHALEINAFEDYRHYGIHRKFDECVKPTLEGTINTILKKCPGIVGETYEFMTNGVLSLIKTENISSKLYEFLSDLEELPNNSKNIFETTVTYNNTSDLNKYEEISKISTRTVEKFLSSEQKSISIYESAI